MTLPLPFFPKSALAYVEAEKNGDNPSAKARAQWWGARGRDRNSTRDARTKDEGEKDDIYFARCFDARNALDDQFAELARTVLHLLLEHREKKELPE
jgi:exonuclease V gamma subunit